MLPSVALVLALTAAAMAPQPPRAGDPHAPGPHAVNGTAVTGQPSERPAQAPALTHDCHAPGGAETPLADRICAAMQAALDHLDAGAKTPARTTRRAPMGSVAALHAEVTLIEAGPRALALRLAWHDCRAGAPPCEPLIEGPILRAEIVDAAIDRLDLVTLAAQLLRATPPPLLAPRPDGGAGP